VNEHVLSVLVVIVGSAPKWTSSVATIDHPKDDHPAEEIGFATIDHVPAAE